MRDSLDWLISVFGSGVVPVFFLVIFIYFGFKLFRDLSGFRSATRALLVDLRSSDGRGKRQKILILVVATVVIFDYFIWLFSTGDHPLFERDYSILPHMGLFGENEWDPMLWVSFFVFAVLLLRIDGRLEQFKEIWGLSITDRKMLVFCSVLWMGAAVSVSYSNGSGNDDVESTGTLISDWYTSNSDCRGLPSDDEKGINGCRRRHEVYEKLQALGYCYGRPGEAGYQNDWHLCGE